MNSLKSVSPLPPGLPKLIKRLWDHLNRRRQYQFGLLIVLMFVCAFAEVLNLGAVLPFLAVLADPDRVFQYHFFKEFAQFFGVTSANQLLLPFTIIFALASFFAGSVRLLQLWINTRFAYAVGHDLSLEVYRRTLYQPYHVHLSRNSSEIISGIGKVDSAIQVLSMFLTLFSALIIAISIVMALLVVDSSVAILAFLGFGGIYVLVTWLTRKRLLSNSQKVAKAQTGRIKALQEGLGGIRDVLLGGNQQAYCNIYRCADLPMRKAQGSNLFISGSPRYAVETLGMVLIAALAYSLSLRSGDMVMVLPVLGALALGAQRLLPALNLAYSSWAAISAQRFSLADVLDLLSQPIQEDELLLPPPLNFNRDICFESVKFRYSQEGPLVLNGLDLVIPRGARVGLVGCTGSGKSTTLDLFMGLLNPTEGKILVDGLQLDNDSKRSWQRIIAHVPQHIFLADSSIAENIAFGETPEAIDKDRVKQAARQAHIADFIESNPKGYDAMVGERGIRLSGGQRQRIGIARALYREATVLVFDEATSSLDNETEEAVMQAIEGLSEDLTILIIAHRLTTLKNCTQIVELGAGVMKRIGTYQEIVKSSGMNTVGKQIR